SYAIWWIRQRILYAISTQGKTIQIPIGKINLFKKVKEVKNNYISTFRREPTTKELKNELLLSEETYIESLIDYDVKYFDDKIDNKTRNNNTFEYFLVSEEEDPMEKFDRDRAIEMGLRALTERERKIIELFFGINQQRCELTDIGRMVGLTRERCRQIKNEAILKMKPIIERHLI